MVLVLFIIVTFLNFRDKKRKIDTLHGTLVLYSLRTVWH